MLHIPKWVAWLCLAIVVFTACTAAAADHFSSVLVPLGLVFLTITAVISSREAGTADEQPVPLLSLATSRAPPFRI